MGFIDRLLGREPEQPSSAAGQAAPDYGTPPGTVQDSRTSARTEDDIAIERYRYLLRTAPPETIEQVHEEAFARLTPEQRAQLFAQLSSEAPAGEAPRDESAPALAQAATRSELRNPGTLERSLSAPAQGGFGMGMGSMFAGSLLGSVAGIVVGSAIAQAFMPDLGAGEASGADASAADSAGADAGGADSGGADASGADAGGADGGGFGDFGGGDFGGGDFGGGFDF
ncbi:hypothetical protein QCD70_00960 [Agreia sp. PsM10]|uniref:hypothetical protein n=1 Tax=Agreia sp. PsM10 TaxID=3030533 RepID=UPI00263BC68E|nr:hypothetical protein [Agreia sp. PsM10]MDN4638803.1 hypothetical protein [Agreia sp. PsM10]